MVPTKHATYETVIERLNALLEGENDEIAAMATTACELHHAFDSFHWTGFYRRVGEQLLKVGPYQGHHGCLSIEFGRGVCGKAAREEVTQIVEDVNKLDYHIACSSNTVSEIVVPVFDGCGQLRAVLDIDSDHPALFDDVDRRYLEAISQLITPCFPISA